MSTLRHRLSNLIGFSEDSTADSEASTRAIRSLSESDSDSGLGRNRKDSTFSRESGYASTATSIEDNAASPKPASPGKLKKAASTTFQALSNSLRSRTQLFYSNVEAARPVTPQNLEDETPQGLREGTTLWSSTRKRIGRSPRATLDNAFDSPRRAESRNLDTNISSPQSTHRRSSLWSSIKGRAIRSPYVGKEVAQAEEQSPTSPRSPIDEFAPFLAVDIPDGSLTVLQLLQRSKSRSGTGSPFSTVRDSMSLYKAKDESTGTASAPESPEGNVTIDSAGRPCVRFLELTPPRTEPKIVRRGHGPNHPVTMSGLSISRTTSLRTGLNDLGVTNLESPHRGLMHKPTQVTNSPVGNEGRLFGESTPTDSPDPPSMGPRNVWNQARADRESRYSALETDVDSESDSDLDLRRFPAKDPALTSNQQGAAKAYFSPDRPSFTKGNLQYAVEAIERLPGKVFDDSSSSEAGVIAPRRSLEEPERAPLAESWELAIAAADRRYEAEHETKQSASDGKVTVAAASPQRPNFLGDLHFAVEAIERKPGVAYDNSTSSSSVHTPEKPGSKPGLFTSSPNLGNGTLQHWCGLGLPPLGYMGLSSHASTDSVSTTESCAVTTHDPLCYTPPPYPSQHMRSSPPGSVKKRRAGEEDICDFQNETSKAGMDPHASVLDQSPWSDLLFDSAIHMKLTAQPLSAAKPRPVSAVDAELKLTKEPLTPDKLRMLEPAEIPLPETPFPASGTSDLPIRLKKDQFPLKEAEASKKDLDIVDEANHSEAPFNAAKLPAFDEPSPPPKQKKKRSPRRKKSRKSLKKLSPSKQDASILAETSGNSKRQYSYSQIVKGDRQVDTLKDSMKDLEGGIITHKESHCPAAPEVTGLPRIEMGPWDDEAKAAVARHLTNVVYDLERLADKENAAAKDEDVEVA